mgnify:CR=1 FL=1
MPSVQGFIEAAKAKHKQAPRRVVFPEGNDVRILQAAYQLEHEGVVQPIVLGNRKALETLANKRGLSLSEIDIIDPETSESLKHYANLYTESRPKTSPQAAQRFVKKPLQFAGMMVKSGDADAMIAGVSNPTARVVTAGLMTIGLAEGIATPSSFFLMILPDFQGQMNKTFIYADCALNVEPSAEQLADIALASASSAKHLLDKKPKVAMLSFSTLGSAKHALADKVVEATCLAKERNPALGLEGELQFDTAISPTIAAKKAADALDVAGQANVFIFPDLNSGNIAYKITQYLGGAQAIGPFLQGFTKPISDLSRGASVEDIVTTTAVLIATT